MPSERHAYLTTSQERFDTIMNSEFPSDDFEEKLKAARSRSMELLKGVLMC